MLSPGAVVDGRYRVDRLIGEGGMGAVYAVRDPSDAAYALKVLLDATDDQLTKRFLREATASAQLRSENVAKVYGSGTLADGTPYLLMELLVGEDLADLVGRVGPLGAQQAVEHLLPVLDVLAEAHRLGMVHRDIKPANLFRTTLPDGSFRVKLLDFGISKPALTGVAPMIQLTQTGTILGSPEYMSPEQLVSSSDVDARADIWALGVTLYELLTGSTAFAGETLAEIVTAIMRDPPRPLRAARPDLPPELEGIVQRCLDKDPELRFSTVTELAAALRAVPTALATAQTMIGHGSPTALGSSPTALGSSPTALGHAETVAGSQPSSAGGATSVAPPTHAQAPTPDPRRAPTVVRAPPPAAPPATPENVGGPRRRLWPFVLAGVVGLPLLGGALILAARAGRASSKMSETPDRDGEGGRDSRSDDDGASTGDDRISKAARRKLEKRLRDAKRKIAGGDYDGADRAASSVLSAIEEKHGLKPGFDRSRLAKEAHRLRTLAFGGKARVGAARRGQSPQDLYGTLGDLGAAAGAATIGARWSPDTPPCALGPAIAAYLLVAQEAASRSYDQALQLEYAVTVLQQADGLCTTWSDFIKESAACELEKRKTCEDVAKVLPKEKKRLEDSKLAP